MATVVSRRRESGSVSDDKGDGDDCREELVELIFFEKDWRDGKAASGAEPRVVGSTREESDRVIPRKDGAHA